MESRDWYDTPLYYDIIYDTDTVKEADLLEGVFERFGRTGGRQPRAVLEPACGSGRLVLEMTRRGWRAAGFDASEKMLRFACERLAEQKLQAQLWSDRMESFAVPKGRRFDLAHCFINTFRYLLTEADAAAFLQRVAAVLKPGGLFVLALHLTDYERTNCEHERWVMDRGRVHVVCNTRTWPADRRRRIERLRTRLQIMDGGRLFQQETVWDYRTYNARQLRAILKHAMPQMEQVACFDFNYDLDAPARLADEQGHVVLVLRNGIP